MIKSTEPEIAVSIVVVAVGVAIIGGMFLLGALFDMQAPKQQPYYGSQGTIAPDTVRFLT
ncbi:MAG: hypothetical protein K2X93_02730 [Candidatus Obscuribacterales bacterium]|nr:hypothetical protein [Candidatus Obscuribacterales bacterium]